MHAFSSTPSANYSARPLELSNASPIIKNGVTPHLNRTNSNIAFGDRENHMTIKHKRAVKSRRDGVLANTPIAVQARLVYDTIESAQSIQENTPVPKQMVTLAKGNNNLDINKHIYTIESCIENHLEVCQGKNMEENQEASRSVLHIRQSREDENKYEGNEDEREGDQEYLVDVEKEDKLGEMILPGSGEVTRRRQRRMHPCEYCDKQFDRPSLLKRHTLTHTGERPFECKFCGKGFSTRSGVNTHERTHTGQRPYLCRICGRRFAAGSNLIFHKYTHTNTRRHACLHCPKAFVTPGDLRKHEYIHTGAWPFRCGVCERGFATERNLKSHEITHTGEHLLQAPQNAAGQKPFVCPVCLKGYAQESSMKTHLRIHQRTSLASPVINSPENKSQSEEALELLSSANSPNSLECTKQLSTWPSNPNSFSTLPDLICEAPPTPHINTSYSYLDPSRVLNHEVSAFSTYQPTTDGQQTSPSRHQLGSKEQSIGPQTPNSPESILSPSEIASLTQNAITRTNWEAAVWIYSRYRAYYNIYMRELLRPSSIEVPAVGGYMVPPMTNALSTHVPVTESSSNIPPAQGYGLTGLSSSFSCASLAAPATSNHLMSVARPAICSLAGSPSSVITGPTGPGMTAQDIIDISSNYSLNYFQQLAQTSMQTPSQSIPDQPFIALQNASVLGLHSLSYPALNTVTHESSNAMPSTGISDLPSESSELFSGKTILNILSDEVIFSRGFPSDKPVRISSASTRSQSEKVV
ncbi:unnamed protein product [Protopolystoma xenopodis]|uniref:C2H2-type domain-containing protein n=1 Tax=Protopolystoma xenopodis TaxID=117903 RepID=A0A3S5A4Z0_9PLAT|nr:unnamed protein product [Protopolystoma xenopodis]